MRRLYQKIYLVFLASLLAVVVVAGLFWKRATVLGGYLAMAGGAAATIAFFFFKSPASYAGLGAFSLAATGMLLGSVLGKPKPTGVAVPTRAAPS